MRPLLVILAVSTLACSGGTGTADPDLDPEMIPEEHDEPLEVEPGDAFHPSREVVDELGRPVMKRPVDPRKRK